MMKITTAKLPQSEIEIVGELDADVFEGYFNKALKKLGEEIELDGFRKGKVPESILVAKIPEIKILEEMAELALNEHYPKIIESEKIDAISRPEIAITKLARKNSLEFKIKTSVMPEVVLPDYQNLAKKVLEGLTDEEKTPEITEEEIENTIMDIRKSRAEKINVAEMAEHVHDENIPHEHPEPELPELNDEFVQSMGPFTDMADFKAKLKENLKLEKTNLAKEKIRLKIVEKIIEETKIDIPQILIEVELDKILYRMESDITAMGMKFEDYLGHLKKTKEDLRKEFTGDAEKKAKLGLVLNKIAEKEKLVVNAEEVEKEVNHILEHYKDADPERARIYAQNILTNEKIFQFLESL